MNYTKEAKDLEFAYKIRRALNESAENIPESTLDRLAVARKIAQSRKKKNAPLKVFAFNTALAGNGGFSFQGPNSWMGKIAVMLPLLLLLIGLFSIYSYEQEQRVTEMAEIDAAVLVDELPPDAYLDTGFNAYLNKVEE
jgi:protein-S-isoprenylcysteine O-methyltransferase Ste14